MLFSEVIGHQEIKERLLNTVKEGRISHAQLFYGPEGSGSLALAIAYAQYINCENRGEYDSCGVCPSCIKYNQIAHPDLHFFYPVARTKSVTKDVMSNKFIQDWRDMVKTHPYFGLQEWYEAIGLTESQGIINAADCNEIIRILGLKNYESKYKVIIIWMAEKLFYSAAPKLLKSLEEPPERTLFLLISENPEMIIKTILSRLQMVRIPRISSEDLTRHLVVKYSLDYAVAERIASQASGNVNFAYNLMKESNGIEDFEFFRAWLRVCYSGNFQQISAWIDDSSKLGREKLKSMFESGLEIFHNIVRYKTADSLMNKGISGEELTFIEKISPFISVRDFNRFADEINSGIYHIERNCSQKVVLMDMSLKVMKILRKIQD